MLEGKGNYGFNAANDTYGDMIEMGILDPTKVTRTALQNAASVASLMLTTECMVAEARRTKPAGGGGMPAAWVAWAAWSRIEGRTPPVRAFRAGARFDNFGNMTQLRAQDLVNEALTEVSGLSHDLLNLIQDELDANAQHFGLRGAGAAMRPRFAAEFETRLLAAALQEALHGGDPLQRASPTLGGLSLVDESQALEDVAVAHVVHAAEDIAKPELYQIGNFFAALKGWRQGA